MDKQKIFFSYSRLDGEAFALRLAGDLRRRSADSWIDQLSIAPGVPWDRAIEEAIRSSFCVLFIATEKSTVSDNVLNEVSYALDEKKKVIPLIFHQCRMPLLLRRLQHIDFTRDYDAALQRLLQTLALEQQGAPPVVSGEETSGNEKPGPAQKDDATETRLSDEPPPHAQKNPSGTLPSPPTPRDQKRKEPANEKKKTNRPSSQSFLP